MKSTLINTNLKDRFGTAEDGRALYRIVWSPVQLEKRSGKFEIWSHGVFLREFVGTQEVQKYQMDPNTRDRWLLEKLIYHPTWELPESANGHYECIWVFRDKEGNYQEPIWRAVNFIVMTVLYGDKETVDKMEEADKKALADEADEFRAMFDDAGGGEIATAIHDGSAVLNAGTKSEVVSQ